MTTRIAPPLLLVGALGGCAATDRAPVPRPSDYAVYAVVLREHFLRPARGEHGLVCEEDEPVTQPTTVVGQTSRLWTRTTRRDSAAAAELPKGMAPLVAALRALDTLPGRALAADSFAVGVPVRIEADSGGAVVAGRGDQGGARRVERAPAPIRFSRVAYGADGTRALVYAVRACREKPVGEVEAGADGVAILVPLERRGVAWVALDPVFLEVE